jgi:hypothetical protein
MTVADPFNDGQRRLKNPVPSLAIRTQRRMQRDGCERPSLTELEVKGR